MSICVSLDENKLSSIFWTPNSETPCTEFILGYANKFCDSKFATSVSFFLFCSDEVFLLFCLEIPSFVFVAHSSFPTCVTRCDRRYWTYCVFLWHLIYHKGRLNFSFHEKLSGNMCSDSLLYLEKLSERLVKINKVWGERCDARRETLILNKS